MKKLVVLTAAAFLTFMAACGGSSSGKYGDVKDFIKDLIAVQDNYVSSIEKAKGPQDIAKAVEVFGEKFVALAQKSNELAEKYPESADWDAAPPAELKDDLAKLEASSERMGKVFYNENVRKYMMDPAVIGAFMELGKKVEAVSFF